MKKLIAILVFAILCASCASSGPAQNPVGPPSSQPAAQNTPQPTATQVPSATPIPSPTPTPAPTYPYLYGTLYPTPSSAEGPLNYFNFTEIARWGKGDILASTWSPDGSIIFISTRLGFHFYSYPDLENFASIDHRQITFPAISPDGKTLAVFTAEAVEVWDIPTLSLRYQQATPPTCLGLGFDAESGNLVGIFRNGQYRPITRMVWQPESGELLETRDYAKLDSWNTVLSTDLRYAANRVTDSVYNIWDLVNDVETYRTEFGFTYKDQPAGAISNDGRFLVLGNARFIDLGGTYALNILTFKDINTMMEIKDGVFILYDRVFENVTIVNALERTSRQVKLKLSLPLAVDADHSRFMDGSGKVYQVNPDLTLELSGQVGDYQLSCCKISSQAAYLAGWNGNELNLYAGADGAPLASVTVEKGGADDILLFTPAEDKLVRISAAEARVEVYALPGLNALFDIPLAPVQPGNRDFLSASISPDGTYLAMTEFPPAYLLILNLGTGKIEHTLYGRYSENLFHPSGLLAVHYYGSAGAEYILKIDPSSGLENGRIPGATLYAMAPDGVNLVVRTPDGKGIMDWEIGITTPIELTGEEELVLRLVSASTGAMFNDMSELTKSAVQKGTRYYSDFGGMFQVYEFLP